MSRIKDSTIGFGSPGRYIQGKGLLHKLPAYTKKTEKKVLVLIDNFFYGEFTDILTEIYKGKQDVVTTEFGKECTVAEIERVAALAKQLDAGIVAGIGGGKTLDTIKGVANSTKLP
ncbi:MAG: iron-containing alcohol dehydrogenase, partial [Eubacteriales bacterium]|nr:iron-containing alcohol dehydrogenase [Eubacteriales bacterium]